MKLPKPILALLTLVLVIGLSVAVFLTSRQGAYGIRTKAKKGEAFLFLLPTQVRVEQGQELRVSLKLDTGRQVAGGVNVIITYDPGYLRPVGTIETGPAFPDLVSEIGDSRITIEGVGSIAGQGTVVDISFVALASGVTDIGIDDSSQVWGEGGSVSILHSLQGAKVTIE